MVSHLLATKLYFPPIRPNIVHRSQLIEKINIGFSRKMTLISAPAGYGKTTLLSEWINQSKNPVGWLSLDQQDNDLKRFLAYLIASLQSIPIEVNEQIFAYLHTQQSNLFERFLIPLINQISMIESHFTLILDDYHLIQSQDVHEALIYLVDNLPSQMHLFIATRTDPPFRLSQLRMRSELCEIRGEDLRFTNDEAVDFLNKRLDLDLTSNDVTLLSEKTEGWIAGLQLAAISLRGHQDKQGFVRAFAGDDRYIADFLLDEALGRQPAHIQAFLLQTSILDQFNAPLCTAVTGQDDSQVILAELERSNLFITSLDNQRNWYRYHHLFADLLRIRQKQSKQDSIDELYQRASSWYEGQQLISEAVRLALLGNDSENVTRMIERYILAIVSTSELYELNRLLNAIPEETTSQNPWLVLAQTWGLAYVGKNELAESKLNKLTTSMESLNENTRLRVQGRIYVLQSFLAASRGDRKGSIQIAQYALSNLSGSDLSLKSFALLLIGNALRFDGNLDNAIEFHNDALSLSELAGDQFLTVSILSRLSDMWRTMGQLGRAYKTSMQALRIVEDGQKATGLQSFALGYIKLRLCRVYYARNELHLALKCADIGLNLAKEWGSFDSISLGYFNLAEIYQAMGNHNKAINFLQKFKDDYPLAHRHQYRLASALEADLYVRSGDINKAIKWAEADGKKADDPIQFVDFQIYKTLAQVLIAQDRLMDAQTLLNRLLEIAEGTGAVEYAIQTLVIKAIAFQNASEMDAAIDTLARALSLAAPEGYHRTFIDQGEQIAQLIYQAALRGIYPEFCNQLLEEFSAPLKLDASPQDDLVDPLTHREIEVLKIIDKGRTNQEIAQELVLSLHTIKSHARNIYSKLGVKNRTEAVARARLLDLLPKD